MENEDKIPLIQRIMEKTIGYNLLGYNPKTERWVHSLRDGGAEFTDKEMEEQKKLFEQILMDGTNSNSREELAQKIVDYQKFLKKNNLNVGDGFFTNYKAWDKVKID